MFSRCAEGIVGIVGSLSLSLTFFLSRYERRSNRRQQQRRRHFWKNSSTFAINCRGSTKTWHKRNRHTRRRSQREGNIQDRRRFLPVFGDCFGRNGVLEKSYWFFVKNAASAWENATLGMESFARLPCLKCLKKIGATRRGTAAAAAVALSHWGGNLITSR